MEFVSVFISDITTAVYFFEVSGQYLRYHHYGTQVWIVWFNNSDIITKVHMYQLSGQYIIYHHYGTHVRDFWVNTSEITMRYAGSFFFSWVFTSSSSKKVYRFELSGSCPQISSLRLTTSNCLGLHLGHHYYSKCVCVALK